MTGFYCCKKVDVQMLIQRIGTPCQVICILYSDLGVQRSCILCTPRVESVVKAVTLQLSQ